MSEGWPYHASNQSVIWGCHVRRLTIPCIKSVCHLGLLCRQKAGHTMHQISLSFGVVMSNSRLTSPCIKSACHLGLSCQTDGWPYHASNQSVIWGCHVRRLAIPCIKSVCHLGLSCQTWVDFAKHQISL